VGADLLVIWGRPMSYGKKRAHAPWDSTGVRVQAPRERLAEITLGRANSQQGLATTCKDLLYRETEGSGRVLVWRMSP